MLITAGQKQIGIVAVNPSTNMEYLQVHYEIRNALQSDRLISVEQLQLEAMFLHPSYLGQRTLILREILRLFDKRVAFVRETSASLPFQSQVMAELVPVLPRNPPFDFYERQSRNVYDANFALHMIHGKLTISNRSVVNSRIVVIGASDVGLNFVKELTFVSSGHVI